MSTVTEAPLEVVSPQAEAEQVDADAKGRPAHARYSPLGILTELRETSWPSARQVLGSLLAVVLISAALATAVHWTDLGLSRAVLDAFHHAVDGGHVLVGVLVGAQVLTAALAAYHALRHPSPGDTLASIFGGQITAQGTGTTPRQRRLAVRMGVSVVLFFAATVALSYVLA